jgi:predicted RNase H-like HicB family nuclease
MQTINVVHIQTNLPWGVFKAQGGNWIAVCEPLGLSVQSETWSELMEDIGETLNAMLQDLLSSNELEKFLRDHGWEAAGPIPRHPDGPVRFDVPFIPAMMGSPT